MEGEAELAEATVAAGAAASAVSPTAGADAPFPGDLRQARRRLSVVSDNKLIEGITGLNVQETVHLDKKGPADEGDYIPSCISAYAGFSKKGYAPYNPRKKNQDALIMAEDPASGTLYLAVLDGHGEVGDKVAQAFKKGIPPALFGHEHWIDDPVRALKETIRALEEGILEDRHIDTDFSGTTFVCAIVRGTSVTMLNIGDSRVTLGSVDKTTGKVTAVALTEDHKPDLPAEKARILAAGGRVFAVQYDDGVDGPPRVWLGHLEVPGLAMSRSLGDKIAHTAGVSSEADVTTRELDPKCDHVLLLATDGLWEFMTDQECVEIALKTEHPREAVHELIGEANERWMKEEQVVDDTTVIVCQIGQRADESVH